jgi:hypothetical protein
MIGRINPELHGHFLKHLGAAMYWRATVMVVSTRRFFLCAALVSASLLSLSQPSNSTWFPFAPARHLAAIGFADDWQKTLVTESGSLAYDFGPGPYTFPRTEVQVGMLELTHATVQQWLPDAATPVVVTHSFAEDLSTLVRAFALVPEAVTGTHFSGGTAQVIRLNGLSGANGWATPPPGTDPSFANVAWGTNRPIEYLVRVTPGSRKQVALGFCESYKSGPGSRVMTVEIEGDSLREVDPMADRGRNQPTVLLTSGHDVNSDGRLAITVHPSSRTPDPNVILNAFWVFPADAQISVDDILSGGASSRAEVHWSCGAELTEFAPNVRTDALLATFEGERFTPVIRIKTRRPLIFDPVTSVVRWHGRPFLASRPVPTSGRWYGDTLLLTLPAGSRRADIVVMQGNSVGAELVRVPDLHEEEIRCKDYWLHEAPLPRMRIRVPDARMQYLLDASLRNIYQVREIVDGRLQYQPGPTVYRGLWLCDVLISGNISMMFGDTASVRTALETGFHHQMPNGQFRSIYPSVSMIETPVFLTMMFRYARTAGNQAWLERNWAIVQKGMGWIESERMRTFDEPGAPYAGLLPPGFVDGGISYRTADYGSVWWAMITLEHGIQAARDLGRDTEAESWCELLGKFERSFHIAAGRDMRLDSLGHRFLPVSVAETTLTIPPPRGQYAFLLPLPYGKFFFGPDTLMKAILQGNLAMLDARVAEGLIVGSGWMNDGVWSWLGAIHSTAHLLSGNGPAAWNILKAVADHASPLATWMEEQQLRADGPRTSGDGSDAEASAFFIQALGSLLVLERPDSLVFCAGVPGEWLQPGSRTTVEDLLTGHGPVSLRLETSSDGKDLSLLIQATQTHAPTGGIRIDLTPFSRAGFRDAQGTILLPSVQLPWGSTYKLPLKRW